MTSQVLVNDPSLDEASQASFVDSARLVAHPMSGEANERLRSSVRALYPAHQQEAFLSLQDRVESLLQELQRV
jgi:hypothetical protein